MKKIHILAAVMLLLLLLTACSPTLTLTGSWSTTVAELDKETMKTTPVEQIWTFGEDGKGSKVTRGLSDGSELTLHFTYLLEEGTVTLTFQDELEPEQRFTLSGGGNTLTLTRDSQQLKLEKYEK